MVDETAKFTDEEALDFHSIGRPGKLEVTPTKPMATQRDLSLAYSPGVAVPVKAIANIPDSIYDYTSKGNMVAVISNGTAILGLGNLGAGASKPVMEGKSVLFKRFADVDSIDLEVETEDVDEFVNCVRLLGASFGGINLEDIKAPECFIIEERLREEMKIPVFHDDQHGTAIITAAGFINALSLTGRKIEKCKVVMNGAGAASIACAELMKAMGLPNDQLIMCDSKGVIYKGREAGMNQWKSAHAADTKARTLEEAMKGADCFIGLSVKGAVTKDMVKAMAKKPIIFAMANPDPEITPEEVSEVRSDAISATGRSDYPNQVNNVLGFPYIFRGALDCRATTINMEMKIAAAEALAELAKQDVPEEVARAYAGRQPKFGPDYIIPAPFDPRLIQYVPPRVAQAAMDTGVAGKPITDMDGYVRQLASRLNPTVATLSQMFDQLRAEPKRVVFAEGEEDKVLRAATAYKNGGYGEPILVGYDDTIREKLAEMGNNPDDFEIVNARLSERNEAYADYLYERLNRRGWLRRDVQRIINRDRNAFAACMVACGDADAMVTGLTRHYWRGLDTAKLVIDPEPGRILMSLAIVVTGTRTVFIADTTVNEKPTAEELADIAIETAQTARELGHEPRLAFLSFSNFGMPLRESQSRVREAVKVLEAKNPDFEFDGEMAADTALNPELMAQYPFSRLSGPANCLIMPALPSANIGYKLLSELGGANVIGPVLVGFSKPIQVARMTSGTSDILNLAAIAAIQAGRVG